MMVLLRRTALHLGACGGNSKIVEFIMLPMTKGNHSVKDRWGISPLFDAIKHEYVTGPRSRLCAMLASALP